jgi:hypothetical protein
MTGAAAVEMVLRLAQKAERPDNVAAWTGDPQLDVDSAVRASLGAIKEVCEDRTELVNLVSGGTQDNPGQAPLRDSRAYGQQRYAEPGHHRLGTAPLSACAPLPPG